MSGFLRYLGLWLLLVAALPAKSMAVSIEPWTFDQYTAGAKAILYGRVSAVAQGGRQATLQVKAYVGPGKAPSVVQLPPTEAIPGGGGAPELTLKLNPDTEYVVFLADLYPQIRFVDARRTVLTVDKTHHVQDMQNNRQTTSRLLESFARERGLTVQSPDAQSPVWGDATTAAPALWKWVTSGFVAVAAGAWLWWRSRQRTR